MKTLEHNGQNAITQARIYAYEKFASNANIQELLNISEHNL